MNCPEHLALKAFGGRLYIWMYWHDVPRESIPLRIWLNPLRYEIFIRAFGRTWTINRYGLPVQNAFYKFKKLFLRKDSQP